MIFEGIRQGPQPDSCRGFGIKCYRGSELIELMRDGYRRFCTRPGYILKRLLALRSWKEFKKKAKAGLRLLTWKRMDKERSSSPIISESR